MNSKLVSMGGIFTFKNEDLFGQRFKSGIQNAECDLFHMLMEDVLNLDGTIDVKMVVAKQYPLHQMWKYVYYLWYHNRAVLPVFQQMSVQAEKSKRVTASAYHFIRTMMMVLQRALPENREAYKVTVMAEDVAEFINRVIVQEYRNKRGINNPFIRKLRDDLLTKLSTIQSRDRRESIPSVNPGIKPENIKVSVHLLPDSSAPGGVRAQTKIT